MKSFALLFALFLIGCTSGSGSGGNSVSKPAATPEQLRSATYGLATVQKLLEIKQKSESSKRSPFSKMILNNFVASQTNQKPGLGTPDDSARKIEKGLNPDDCVFDLPKDEKPKEPSNGLLDPKDLAAHVAITGEQCPLNALIDVTVRQVGENFNAVIVMTYTAKSPDMQLELGSKQSRLDGSITGTVRQLANDGGELEMVMQMNGAGETRNGEKFLVAVSLNAQARVTPPPQNSPEPPNFDDIILMTFGESQEYRFQDAASVLSSTMTMKGLSATATYQLNGQEVSAEEYQKYTSGLRLPGMVPPSEDNSNPGTGPAPIGTPMMCQVQIYDAVDVSIDDLNKFLAGQGQLQGHAIHAGMSCRSNSSEQIDYKGQALGLSLSQQPEYIEILITRGTRSNPIYVQRDAMTSLVGQTNDVTHLVMCFPVEKCDF